MTGRDASCVGAVVVATAVAWCGFFVHSVADLPARPSSVPIHPFRRGLDGFTPARAAIADSFRTLPG